jgi:hypothetical protein
LLILFFISINVVLGTLLPTAGKFIENFAKWLHPMRFKMKMAWFDSLLLRC